MSREIGTVRSCPTGSLVTKWEKGVNVKGRIDQMCTFGLQLP